MERAWTEPGRGACWLGVFRMLLGFGSVRPAGRGCVVRVAVVKVVCVRERDNELPSQWVLNCIQ